ncbi:MAG: 16S rRNA (uracil(1498)-N(3))-methyltransferase [Ruminococcus sp.]|nr:16S rRNA (uracil(1498)-N(3))-methyltransferase [Ruminococcus sp.]
MPWFFTDEEIKNEKFNIDGENARHISKSLRMKRGEKLTLVSPSKTQFDCEIDNISNELVGVKILEKKPCENEPETQITLYQALPKSDKMEFIIQKCVELGVYKIVPTISSRCVSRPDKKSLEKKLARWQKIAKEAAQQSRRGIIPEICEAVSFKQAVENSKENEQNIIFYELGGESIKNIIENSRPKNIGIFIGSEGGFEQSEVDLALENGARVATLGKRILRAETAPLAALSIIMYALGEMDDDAKTAEEFENDRNNLCTEN